MIRADLDKIVGHEWGKFRNYSLSTILHEVRHDNLS